MVSRSMMHGGMARSNTLDRRMGRRIIIIIIILITKYYLYYYIIITISNMIFGIWLTGTSGY